GRGRGPGAAPLHQPQPQGLPRRRGRGHGRLPSPVGARPLPPPVGLRRRPARVLPRMPRGHRRRRYLEILANLRSAIDGVAFSTDIIVGFPGETEADFADTLDLVEQARFDSAFTFQYSLRPGTEAATMPDQVPPDVVKDRFQRLLKLQERISLEANRALVGTEVEL